MPKIDKILIANRGEIAMRIIRTCRDMGISTVAVYSEVDHVSPHVLWADESVCIGGVSSAESYLDSKKIIMAAIETGADAIHPGYGFLSENAVFAKTCADNQLVFIGPDPDAIELMGDKTAARKLMAETGVPCPPGTTTAIDDRDDVKKIAEQIGYPVLIKAAAGGGGKGMRIIAKPEEIVAGIKAATSEAKNAFGDGRVYIEKYLVSPRHVEFQIISDNFGNTCHLFDRECSIQRRHQKVVEEAPCAFLSDELRKKMADAAVAAARACNYNGAGTIEFLIDKDRNFYFLEMNTRLQVEHPITELITGVDLVELQIRVARGEELPFEQDEIELKGHAIECRIYAEDPADNFMPSTGVLHTHRPASGPGVRVDSGVEEGQEVTIYYDPMISKLCTHAPSREQAINRMNRALIEYDITGCNTTIPFCRYVMHHSAFINSEYDTHFVANHYDPSNFLQNQNRSGEAIAISAAMLSHTLLHSNGKNKAVANDDKALVSNWWKNRR